MKCEECKEQDDCSYYQQWLNTRSVCCPHGDYQKDKKRRMEELSRRVKYENLKPLQTKGKMPLVHGVGKKI